METIAPSGLRCADCKQPHPPEDMLDAWCFACFGLRIRAPFVGRCACQAPPPEPLVALAGAPVRCVWCSASVRWAVQRVGGLYCRCGGRLPVAH